MRKIKLLSALIIALLCTSTIHAVQVRNYIVNQDFTGVTVHPTGWSTANDANYSLFGTGGGYNYITPANQLNVTTGSSSKNQGLKITFPSSGTETNVNLEFDWTITTATVGSKNALGLILKDNVASAYTNTGDVMILYCSGTDGMLHCQNIDNTTAVFQDLSASGSFLKSGVDAATCNTNNASTITTCGWALGQTIHIKATFDFSTHKITYLKLSNTTTGATSYENTTGLDFLSATAANISKVCITNTRISASGNGSNSVSNTAIDNFQMYTFIDAVLDNVTINYLDPSNNSFKTARVAIDNAVGSTYAALLSDKETYNDGTFVYAYDAATTAAHAGNGTGDTAVVKTGGSTINLRFTKTAVTSGTYTWTNATSANWNETEANFTTDGSNSLAYQNSNAVSFPATATQKNVMLTGALDLGNNNVNLAGDGYTLAGTGSLAGTGTLNMNLNTGETATLNLNNNMTGGVAVNGGVAVIQKDAAASKLSVANGATLNLSTGAAFSKAITGTSGLLNIMPTSNVTYTSAISSVDALNYTLPSAGSVNTSGAYSSMPILNNTFSGAINVETPLSAAMFGSTINFTNNKVALGDNVSMVYAATPASVASISIGELTGTSTSKIQGVRVRTATYSIGGLGTDAVYAGTFENFGADAWSNIPVLNITKNGTGSLTLTGNSSAYVSGTTTVSAGRLIVNGTLGTTATTASVGVNGTLSGTGTIGGATTVNGTLEGSLNFGSSLTMAGTTNLEVNGFNPGNYNVINVAEAVNYGGIINITVNASAPETNTAIKLINAAIYNPSVTTINVPSGYAFNQATGTLTYNGTPNSLQSDISGTLSIYPTLSTGNVTIAGAKSAIVEVVNIAGVIAKQIVVNNENATIQLNGLANGTYFVKVHLTDGSVKIQKVILQK